MKRFIILAAALLCAVAVNAQQLKTAQGITIETYEPKPEPEPRIKKPKKTFAPIERGFEQSVEVGVSPAVAYTECVYMNLEYIAGYRFNKNLFIGGGAGLDLKVCTSDSSLAIPIYAHARAYSRQFGRWQPYFGISVGTAIGLTSYDGDGYYDYYDYYHPIVGLQLNPTLGCSFRINNSLSCYCSIGWMMKSMNQYYNGHLDGCIMDHTISIRIGVTF